MKKGLLMALLIVLFGLSIIATENLTRAQTNDFYYSGYRDPTNVTTINDWYNFNLDLNMNEYQTISYNVNYVIKWRDGLQYEYYTFYDLIEIYKADSSTYFIYFGPSTSVDYSEINIPIIEYQITSSTTQVNTSNSQGVPYFDGLYINELIQNNTWLSIFMSIFRLNVYETVSIESILEDEPISNLQFFLLDYEFYQNIYSYYINRIDELEDDIEDLEDAYDQVYDAYTSAVQQREDASNFFSDLFGSFSELFSVQIIPGFTILTFIVIPLMFMMLGIVIHLLKG